MRDKLRMFASINTDYQGGDFRNYLVEVENNNVLDDPQKAMRYYRRIQVGTIALSIQASYMHYSVPRLTVNKDKYSEMELAMFSFDGDDEYWIKDYHPVISKFDKYNELKECQSGTVYANVPVGLIQELVEYLYKID